MAEAMGELSDTEIRELLAGHHLGRLTCHGQAGAGARSVKYALRDASHVALEAPDAYEDLPRAGTSVRFEVDEIHGPQRWSAVIGWGVLEPIAGGAEYGVRFTALRGFYHGARH